MALTYDFAAPGQTGTTGGGFTSGGFTNSTGGGGNFFNVLGSVTTALQIQKIADQTTGWSTDLAFQKFNPALGKLEDINLTLVSDVKARQSFENLGATAAGISGSQLALLNLALNGTSLLKVGTALNRVRKPCRLRRDDGFRRDLGHHLRRSHGLRPERHGLVRRSGPYALHRGGAALLGLSATGTSLVDGPGNMLLDLAEQAGATVDLSYTYLPGDPPAAMAEPPSWGIFAGPLALWGFMLRRRRREIAPGGGLAAISAG